MSEVGDDADDSAASDATAGSDATVTDDGVPVVQLPSTTFDLGEIACGQSASKGFTIANGGTGTLVVNASVTGAAFGISTTSLSIAPGASGTLTVQAVTSASALAGTQLSGALTLFTNDPANASLIVGLTATPSGAQLAFPPGAPAAVSFPSTEVGFAAAAVQVVLKNIGNVPATFTLGAPSDAEFTLSGSGQGANAIHLDPGAVYSTRAGFTPSASAGNQVSASSAITLTGSTCGTSLSSISLSGTVGRGQVTGWPSGPVDFGPADCGGAAPVYQLVVLRNGGATNATITSATITGPAGFTTDAQGLDIPAGLTADFKVYAPAVPMLSSLSPISATLTIVTDAEASPHTITLTEEPQGAVLAFDTSATPGFGSFGRVVLLQPESQTFSVVNTGTEPATVTLSPAASASSSALSPFEVSVPSFTIPGNSTQADSVVFAPTGATNTGAITMTATGTLCSALPSPLPLSGAGIGGGPSLTPTALAFAATCGGTAPQSQSFALSNQGSANLNWSMSAPTGPGAAYYQLSASPAPGLLIPGQSSTVTVTPSAIPSPAPSGNQSFYSARVTLTTDVPFDDPHFVNLSETPLGDQLELSVSDLRFGQFPIDTATVAQEFTLTNNANRGSPAANVSLSVTGSGASGYALGRAAVSNLAPGTESGGVGVTFEPTSAASYPADVSFTTSDSLCTPLPSPLQLTGTGTQGQVSVSATTLTFGTDANDPGGLVNCGATGLARTFTISNTGNQLVHVTALTLGLGASSPYALTGEATALPFELPIGGTTTLTVTPSAIPASVADPNDPTPFTDSLTVTTDAALDSPHRIALVMQARGAVIANTPLDTTWSFGTLGNGLIGTFSTTITNSGNAGASIAFQGLTNPTVFGLASAPTTVPPDGVTQVVGQFSPPATNQVWTDHGTLAVTPAEVFCEPLPASWNSPMISLSGSSISGSLPVTVAGSLTFPSSECGAAAPAAQSITLTNTTNIAYVFTAQLSSGAFYTLQNPTVGDASAGIIPGSGVVVLGVTPQTVTPGPTVVAGSAPYADDLVISIQSPTPSGVTIPISWTLDGAMLSLPEGLGPDRDTSGNLFYPADSQSGFTLPIANSGTASASVSFGIQPTGAFTFSPSPPVTVVPGITALPRLASAASSAACPAATTGSATFLYSGPVCRPIPFTQVSIDSCVGTF